MIGSTVRASNSTEWPNVKPGDVIEVEYKLRKFLAVVLSVSFNTEGIADHLACTVLYYLEPEATFTNFIDPWYIYDVSNCNLKIIK